MKKEIISQPSSHQPILDEIEKKEDVYYTDELAKAFKFYIDRIKKAKEQRDQARPEFDDMTYEQDYELNLRAAVSYLRKKKNDDEVRIVGGTTEKKIEIVANELLAMNLEPEVLAFDKDDNELVGLGRNIGDIVKRTCQIEKDEDVWNESVFELLTQRAVFLEDIYIDDEVIDKKKPSNSTLGMQTYFSSSKSKRKIQMCKKRLLDGRQVFLGNINLPAYEFDNQPYIIKYDRMLYEEARKIYGDWRMWNKVKPGSKGMVGDFNGTFNWRLNSLDNDEVEILHYYCYPDDEYQVIINGVMMLDPQTALPYENEGYNIKMFVLKRIHSKFAYGKSLVSSAKTLQGLDDEAIRLLIYKFRQAIKPPMAVQGKKIYSKDIWAPGAVTYGLRDKDFSKLIDHQGVTQSEMAIEDFINSKVEEFVGASSLMQGVSDNKTETAREATMLLRQGIKSLGQAVLAVMRMKRDMTYLRIGNILENYLEPVGKKYNALSKSVDNWYRKFTIKNAEFENGKYGNKIIQFMDRSLQPEERQQLYDFSEEQTKMGKNIRIETVNIKKLKEVYIYWYVSVNQTQKDSSELQQMMFEDSLVQAANVSKLTGKQLNPDKITQDYERIWNKKDYFMKSAENLNFKAQDLLNKLEGLGGSSAQTLKPTASPKPSINTAMNE